ncbi:MAG: C39 family peptidase [Ezakiella sp.]|nr:C39 family peptidase [Ezakiella sp.]
MKRFLLYLTAVVVVVICIYIFASYGIFNNVNEMVIPENKKNVTDISNIIVQDEINDSYVKFNDRFKGEAGYTTDIKEAKSRLKKYATVDEDAEFILKNIDKYPDNLIKLASNRVDALPFIRRYLDQKEVKQTTEESYITGRKFPLYILWDERWGYKQYDDLFVTIGCGPTTAAMIINGYGGELTPIELMDEEIENRFYIENTGTSWEGIRALLKNHGIKTEDIPTVKTKYIKHLETGNPILINVRPSKFTGVGHFMLIAGYDGENFILNDSNSLRYSLEPLSFEELEQVVRGAWTVSK